MIAAAVSSHVDSIVRMGIGAVYRSLPTLNSKRTVRDALLLTEEALSTVDCLADGVDFESDLAQGPVIEQVASIKNERRKLH